MSFVQIISFVALFAIGFFAGMKMSESKLKPKIKKLQKYIDSLDEPVETDGEQK